MCVSYSYAALRHYVFTIVYIHVYNIIMYVYIGIQ